MLVKEGSDRPWDAGRWHPIRSIFGRRSFKYIATFFLNRIPPIWLHTMYTYANVIDVYTFYISNCVSFAAHMCLRMCDKATNITWDIPLRGIFHVLVVFVPALASPFQYHLNAEQNGLQLLNTCRERSRGGYNLILVTFCHRCVVVVFRSHKIT